MSEELRERSRRNRLIRQRLQAHPSVNPHFELFVFEKEKMPEGLSRKSEGILSRVFKAFDNGEKKLLDKADGLKPGNARRDSKIMVLNYKGETIAVAEIVERHDSIGFLGNFVNRIARSGKAYERISHDGIRLPHSLGLDLLYHLCGMENSEVRIFGLSAEGKNLFRKMKKIPSFGYPAYKKPNPSSRPFSDRKKYSRRIYR
jgi:hypothetical protein